VSQKITLIDGTAGAADERDVKSNVTSADARRIQIAASVVAGQSITSTASQVGISREHASRIANASETQQIIASLVHANLERIYELFEESLKVIRQAFRARRKVVNKGEVIDLGPDHYARLTAVARLVQMMTAGRPVPRPKQKKDDDGLITIEDLKRLIDATQEEGERRRAEKLAGRCETQL
jgi:hypothetical protein